MTKALESDNIMKPKPKKKKAAKRTSKRQSDPSELTDVECNELQEVLEGRSEHSRGTRKKLHQMIAGAVYADQLAADPKILTDPIGSLARGCSIDYAAELIAQLDPRDPLEEMLVMQALWAHGRTAHLSVLATRQTDLEALRIINQAADKSTNTFRRLMVALAEYRRPPRAGDSFTAIKQANIARQQIVHNSESRESQTENMTNEQGFINDEAMQAEPSKALPADAGGVGLTSPVGQSHEAVDAQHGATNA